MRRRILLGAAGLLAAMVAKVALTPIPHLEVPGHQVHGAYHVYSAWSHDAHGSADDIADAASAAGLDFVVVSDHDVLVPQFLEVDDGVLLIPATEETTSFGNVISLGARRALTAKEKHSGTPLAAIRAVGGVPMIAHPLNLKRPWNDWGEINLAAGLETLSYDNLWRLALRHPFSRGLIPGLLELPFNLRLAETQILRRPTATLAKYDTLRQHHPLAQVCALDAHGWPSYQSLFGLMSMYLDGIDALHGTKDAPKVLQALEEGHAYCAVDAIAPAPGFHFQAVAPGRPTLNEGDEGAAEGRLLKVTLPKGVAHLPAWVHFFRNGKELVRVPGSLQLAAPGPGDYRVEVWTKLPGAFFRGPKVPWILSNPIRLR